MRALRLREVKSLVDDTQLKGWGGGEDVARHLVSELIYLINTLWTDRAETMAESVKELAVQA